MKRTILHGFSPLLALFFVLPGFLAACGNSGDGTSLTGISKELPRGYGLLYSFGSPTTNGANPNAGVIMDASGNLYGTTAWGGSSDMGTVFELDTSGTLTVLHSFTGYPIDGSQSNSGLGQPAWGHAYPIPGLIMDNAGNLYGNAQLGGGHGGGAVYRIDASGNETVLTSFYGPDGIYPSGKLAMDTSGNLYGTTTYGGPYSLGTVFKVDTSGTKTVIYNFIFDDEEFLLDTHGAYPLAGLIMDNKGSLYGTTFNGGAHGGGTVFEINTSGTLTVLHSFTVGSTGPAFPASELILDNEGNLYGTTVGGGANDLGTVFKLDLSGTLTVLHSFDGTDGRDPYSALIMDNKGNLYGTTDSGGANNRGTAFKLDTSGTLTVLHSFDGADGAEPMGLIMDNKGDLYGTTFSGGLYDLGTIFRLAL